MTTFKPMLAGKPKVDKEGNLKLNFPLFVQVKLDGIRATVVNGRLLTRTLKEVPNRHIFETLSKPEFEGLDGELIVGDPTAPDVYRRTNSGCMTVEGTPQFTFYVFDNWVLGGDHFINRFAAVKAMDLPSYIKVVAMTYASDHEELAEAEAKIVEMGFEGVILRGPNTLYKFGRGSGTKCDLLKLKRFEDSEAEIIGVEEEMHNGNIAMTNALGRTERSSVKANKSGKGTLGALIVRDIYTGVEFNVGTGFKADERKELWANYQIEQAPNTQTPSQRIIGQTIKYKHFPIGAKDKPRHPVFLGFRAPEDMPS